MEGLQSLTNEQFRREPQIDRSSLYKEMTDKILIKSYRSSGTGNELLKIP